MSNYQVIEFDKKTGAVDYPRKFLLCHEENEKYFTAAKKYTNHEIVIVVNE